MEKYNTEEIDAQIQAKRDKFNAQVIESFWSENGELTYVLNEGADLEEYGKLIETILAETSEPEMDFICKLIHADGQHSVNIECNFAPEVSLFTDEDDIVTEYDTLEDFKEFWHRDVQKQLNADREVVFDVSDGVDLMSASRLIFTFINDSTKLGQDITIILKNISGGEERLLVPSNS